jgi:outer membrane immunogenic protein
MAWVRFSRVEVCAMSIRLALLTTLAAVSAPLAVQAADMQPVAPLDPAVAQAGVDWTGVYVGVNAGYSVGDFGTFTPAAGDHYSGDGALGGFQIGYNKQLGSVVIGVEGDVQAAGIDGSTGLPGGGASTDSSLDWVSTARGRIGYAFDKTLVYATAGAAVAGLDNEVSTPTGASHDDQTAWGLAVGGGVERALTDKLTLKAEYLYLDLDKEPVDAGPPDQSTEWDGHVMRLGANFKF